MAVLDLANNYTIEVKFCTYNVVSVIINLDANLFYLFIICLFFIYNIYIYLCIYLFNYLFSYLFIYLLFRYVISIFFMLFILRFFYNLVIFIYICRYVYV